MDQNPHITKQVGLYLALGAALLMMLCDARAGQAYPGWAAITVAADAHAPERKNDSPNLPHFFYHLNS